MKDKSDANKGSERVSTSDAPSRSADSATSATAAAEPLDSVDAFLQRLDNRNIAKMLNQDRDRPDIAEIESERFATNTANTVVAAETNPRMLQPRSLQAGSLELETFRLPAAALPPRSVQVRRWLGDGKPLSSTSIAHLGSRLGLELDAVRIHDHPAAHRLAAALHAAAFTIGRDIVFGATQFDTGSSRGRHLLAHELNHVAQQTFGRIADHPLSGIARLLDPSGRTSLQRQPAPGPTPAVVPTTAPTVTTDETFDLYEDIEDDVTLDAGIDATVHEDANQKWWNDLNLMEAWPLRDFDPFAQPKAYANRVARAQKLLRGGGVKWVEGGKFKADGILGPRAFLALQEVAMNATHPLRLQIQGLGFDLDAIAIADHVRIDALGYARTPEFLLQTPIDVYGESAVRYYDTYYSMLIGDRENFDVLLFGGTAPPNTRREDRIELMRRLYGMKSNKLKATLALVEVERDFVHSKLDTKRAVENDKRAAANEAAVYFRFAADSAHSLAQMDGEFAVIRALENAFKKMPEEKLQAAADGINRLVEHQKFDPEPGSTLISGVLLAIYLPAIEKDRLDAVVATYTAERDAKREAERTRIEENNRESAHQRADIIVELLQDTDTHHLIVESKLREELKRAMHEQAFFDLVLDDLAARPGGMFDKLFDRVRKIDGYYLLSLLVEAARAGRYRDHARVRNAQEELIRRHGKTRTHRYEINTSGGTVFLDRDTKLEVGQVAGDHNTLFLIDEDREQLKPDARKKLEAELENQSRAYIARLLEGQEPAKSQENVGEELLKQAWAAAGLDTDRDIEDVEWQESVRLLGVREGPDRGDGVTRYEVKYERVERIVGGEGGDTEWTPVAGGRNDWRSEYDFEYDTFWYPYSQQADVMVGFAKVVLIGAVVAVAWEVGVIGALVSAGGGAVPVALSIGISMAIYMITHKRWTLEGLLMAGVEGYLAAVGFRLFAPAGKVVARLVIPATLERVTFGRLVAAFVLKHGAVGGLTGGMMGPSVLFMHDLVRVAQRGSSLSPFTNYLKSAGVGMLLGAVFEIGGSALLAPIFRAADTTVLSKMSEIITVLRAHEPPVTPGQWMSEVSLSMSAFKKFLGQNMDEILANGVYNGVKEKVAEAGKAWLTGVRGTLQQQVIELAGVHLTRDASNGLERLLTLGRTTLGDDALATMLQQARQMPERIDPWLRFIGGVDETMAKGLVTTSQLRPLLESGNVVALGLRRTPAEMMNLMTLRFGNALDALEQFSLRTNKLNSGTADAMLDALRTRGTAVTPRSLLSAAEAGAAIDDELLGGLGRVLEGSTPSAVDAVLEKMARDRIDSFLRGLRSADVAEVDAVKKLIAAHKTDVAAWGLTLPGKEALVLIDSLTPAARDAITDITAKQAQDLVAALSDTHVNTALSQGTAPGALKGSDLQTMRDYWHDAAIRDYMRWAGAAPNRLNALKGTAGAISSGARRLKPATPLTANSLIVDSNALFGIEALMRGTPFKDVPVVGGGIIQGLPQHRQDAINALRKQRGLGEYVEPPAGVTPTIKDIVGEGADLRANDTIASEIVVGEPRVGRSPVLDDLAGLGDARKHADYENVFDDLQKAKVGEDKGARDRTVIADALLAPRTPGISPTLIIVDRPVVIALAKNFAPPPRVVTTTNKNAWGEVTAFYPKGEFTIVLHGHSLRIVFKPPPP